MHPLKAALDVIQTSRDLRDYLGTQVGDTDEWPVEIAFDSDKEADVFIRLYEALDQALEAFDMMTQ